MTAILNGEITITVEGKTTTIKIRDKHLYDYFDRVAYTRKLSKSIRNAAKK